MPPTCTTPKQKFHVGPAKWTQHAVTLKFWFFFEVYWLTVYPYTNHPRCHSSYESYSILRRTSWCQFINHWLHYRWISCSKVPKGCIGKTTSMQGTIKSRSKRKQNWLRSVRNQKESWDFPTELWVEKSRLQMCSYSLSRYYHSHIYTY